MRRIVTSHDVSLLITAMSPKRIRCATLFYQLVVPPPLSRRYATHRSPLSAAPFCSTRAYVTIRDSPPMARKAERRRRRPPRQPGIRECQRRQRSAMPPGLRQQPFHAGYEPVTTNRQGSARRASLQKPSFQAQPTIPSLSMIVQGQHRQ